MSTPVPAEAITAAAVVLHDEGCCDGNTSTCGRWNSRLPGYDGLKHIGYYEDRAREVLAAAAPHITAAERASLVQELCDKTAEWLGDAADSDHPVQRQTLEDCAGDITDLLRARGEDITT